MFAPSDAERLNSKPHMVGGMSDETTGPVTPYDFDNDPDGLTKDDFGDDQDPLLQLLLWVVPGQSDSGQSVGITVMVNGVVISGSAVSFAQWQKLWTAELTAASKPLRDGFEAVLKTWADESAALVERRDAADLPTPPSPFLHLSNAEIITGGFRRRLGLMRVRRARIDAWTLGQPAE